MRHFRNVGLSILAALICVAFALAQDSMDKKPAGDMGKKSSDMSMGMPMPKPSSEQIKMNKMMLGTWHTAETFEVSDMMPKGGKGTGTAVIKPGPGGLSVVEDYHSHSAAGSFEGHGVFWWDDKAQGYKSVWCDSTTPSGCVVSNGLGKWEGENLVFNDEQDMMGKKQAMKDTLMSDKPGSMTLSMEMGEDNGPMKKMMTINYTKVPSAPKGAAGESAPAKP